MFVCFQFYTYFIYRTNLAMTDKRMYYLVSIDKRRKYCKPHYQQINDRYKPRSEEQKSKRKGFKCRKQ